MSKEQNYRTAYANALNKSLEIFASYNEKSVNDVMSDRKSVV